MDVYKSASNFLVNIKKANDCTSALISSTSNDQDVRVNKFKSFGFVKIKE